VDWGHPVLEHKTGFVSMKKILKAGKETVIEVRENEITNKTIKNLVKQKL